MILRGDCLEKLRSLPDNSVDAIVTDPPYGLSEHGDVSRALDCWLKGEVYTHSGKGFMGKEWDAFVPGPEIWREAYRVLKPGAHGLVFAGTRSFDLMAIALRLAGFEYRDCLMWLQGQGFPKSLDISKAIDKAAGAEREVVGVNPNHRGESQMRNPYTKSLGQDGAITAPATDAAKQWSGWGTALKPAWEPVVLVRKPLSEKNVAANVLKWGTGGINVDGCRIATDETLGRLNHTLSTFNHANTTPYVDNSKGLGRFPANLILDEEAAAALDEQSGTLTSGRLGPGHKDGGKEVGSLGAYAGRTIDREFGNDSSGASRFFYVAKVAPSERGDSTHPTMKPLKLMRYLCRLVTPKGGLVLDPFAGSGSTGVAALQEGFRFIGIEREAEYAEIAERRIEAVML